MLSLSAMVETNGDYRLRFLDDPVLRKKAAAVPAWTAAEADLVRAMADVMVAHRGVGLAAPQLGVLKRVIVVHPGILPPGGDTVLVNPAVVSRSEEELEEDEGCLSLLSVAAPLKRPSRAVVRYLNARGEPREMEVEEFGARAVLHELDHLDGVLYIDHLSRLKRKQVRDEFRKLYRELGLA